MSSSGVNKPEEEFIQFVGVADLEAAERPRVEEICRSEFEKVRNIAKLNQIKVHVKVYGKAPPEAEKEGKAARKKYSIHLQGISGSKTFDVDKASDFDLARALRKAFKDLRAMLEHKFHGETTRPHGESTSTLE